MAKAKAIVKRRKAVGNIKKITRTMQLIATAKFQKAITRATATRPYTERLQALVEQVSQQVTDIKHPLLSVNSGTGRSALLVLTSNRGLCGGYNARILEIALGHIREAGPDHGVQLDVVGKKGITYLRFLGRPMRKHYDHFGDRIGFESVELLANEFIDQYRARELDSVQVAYMKFVSVSRQVPSLMQLLPLQSHPALQEEGAAPEAEVQYDFTPAPSALLAELLPATVRMQLFQCFTDAQVSEQVARMVAMKAATDAATDMIKILTRTYNRARQTQITMELLDILGGVEALAK